MSAPATVLDYLYAPESLSWDARFAEILHLRNTGIAAEEIPDRLAISHQTIYDAARRYDRPDVLEAIAIKETIK